MRVIVLNERQAGAAIEGVVRQERIETAQLAVDTHGYTDFAMMLAHLVKGSVTMPLSPGSTVVVVSSGAAIDGSPLSGGYAGAKRMQWLLAGYAQQLSDRKKLGIRFLAVVPHQLIEGTEIGNGAAAAYGASQGISGADFMKRFKVPLDADKVAAAIVGSLRGDVAQGVTAIEVTGQGVEPLG